MQRAELLAELERLAAEAVAARAQITEIAGRIKTVRERLERPSAAGEPPAQVHSAG